ncbi:MAG: hypothetical protein HLUCCA12_12065 [Rhodobacteraceae bacterium HLUCCA12]|nr:MAG: hypothetical protein HLUCCA12_12065 [Rhodobacteraceae bacterium HLUCCA12]
MSDLNIAAWGIIGFVALVVIFRWLDHRHKVRAWRKAGRQAHRIIYGCDPEQGNGRNDP